MLTVNSNTMQRIPEGYEFDWIAQNIFCPIYPVIVDDILARIPRRDGVLIDVGCGSGHLGLALLERTRYKGCLIDINQTALELGRAHARERGLADRAVFMRQDVHSMDFPDYQPWLLSFLGRFGEGSDRDIPGIGSGRQYIYRRRNGKRGVGRIHPSADAGCYAGVARWAAATQR